VKSAQAQWLDMRLDRSDPLVQRLNIRIQTHKYKTIPGLYEKRCQPVF
jgi:hypothetical protein